MAIPPAHNRVIFTGTLTQVAAGGSEIFDYSMSDASAMSPEDLAQALLPVASTAWGPDGSLGLSEFANLTGCRVEAVDGTGHVTSSYLATQAPQMGLNTNWPCTVICYALTLETGQVDNRGRKIRGRFYPPGGVAQVAGATCTPADATQYANSWAAHITALNSAGAVISVASTTKGGVVVPVTAISADIVVDTQRRRKNRVSSTRTANQNV